ncbi:hypothetical protein GPZ77_34830 (plasmid) [Streptomyces sp. QHH-9511]|uniref:hypothetical protein n=1 Tax=Streptomyces sp. QHH-9511 TaxID=2684468 RepID=UPI0013195CC9|nr:hypothetical protein [Streptomyces sp. QHH-9511]QGZ53403.1 hypothetical protein GPZ77_34830 [Streptomyces sp. QHH-9511]
MSSAEHAPAPQTSAGSVIHLAHRARRKAPPIAAVENSPAQELAFTVQAMFQAHGRSLTDPATAQAFETTLEVVMLLVDGARAQDVVGETEYQDLRAMLEDMRHAPQLV